MKYNVRVSVVEVIEASSPEVAEARLRTRIRAAGFEPYDGDDFDTFEAEE